MPLQNRVTPTGDIVADNARGTMMGNRGGALHDADRKLGTRRWVSRQWICCHLAFNDRHRRVMAPRRYTELFFLDEATAFAAGHRPCFECRRADAEHFAALWSRARGLETRPRADEIDQILHAERLDTPSAKRPHTVVAKRLHPMSLDAMPPGSMFLDRETARPALVQACHIRAWTSAGYGPPSPRPASIGVEALTPPSIIAAIKLGYRPTIHETAGE